MYYPRYLPLRFQSPNPQPDRLPSSILASSAQISRAYQFHHICPDYCPYTKRGMGVKLVLQRAI
jgi:hypothetical protein